MQATFWFLGVFGVSGVMLVMYLRHLQKKASKVEALEHENQRIKAEKDAAKAIVEIYATPRGDKSSVVERL